AGNRKSSGGTEEMARGVGRSPGIVSREPCNPVHPERQGAAPGSVVADGRAEAPATSPHSRALANAKPKPTPAPCNPVRRRLVARVEDRERSSARCYAGLRPVSLEMASRDAEETGAGLRRLASSR